MSHILEVEQAERARAEGGGGVYHFGAATGGGYAFPDGPVVVSSVKAPAETDAQRIARLSQEIGRLTAELRNVRAELQVERCGGPTRLQTVEVPYGDGSVMVAYEIDTCDRDDGTTTDEAYAVAVWIGGQWIDQCELGAFGEELNDALPVALAEEYAP